MIGALDVNRRHGCWPDRQQLLLLRAALLDGDAARLAWREWAASSAIERVDAGSSRLLPLLYENLMRIGEPAPVLDRLKGIHRHTWCRNQALFGRVATAVSTLDRAGIPSLLLKGVPLAVAHYGTAAVRPMADVDLLVRPSDASGAVRALATAGWRPVVEPPAWPAEPLASWALVNGEGHELDLHWRVFCESYRSDELLWARATTVNVHGTTSRALAAPEQLLHVLVHGLKWNPVPSIRWVADSMAVLRRAGDGFEWNALLEVAASRRFEPIVQAGCAYLRTALDAPIPDEVARRLDARPMTAGERVALAARMRPGPIPAAYRVWCDYRRFADEHHLRPGPLGLWRYMRGVWQADGRSLGSIIAGKVASRVRHANAARSL